jgi:hypothetical protein
MKHSRLAALKYSWLTYRRDALWFPLATLAIFAAILPLVDGRAALRFNVARAFLGFIVPLLGGILAAYAVLDDPALELRFATPVRPAAVLLGRLGLILAILAACALALEAEAAALGVRLAPLGGFLAAQLAWFLPTLALAALGVAGSLAGAATATGAFLAAALWLVEVMMKGWFEMNARPLYLFLGVLDPAAPGLATNRLSLAGLSAVCLFVSWRLLHRRERYI